MPQANIVEKAYSPYLDPLSYGRVIEICLLYIHTWPALKFDFTPIQQYLYIEIQQLFPKLTLSGFILIAKLSQDPTFSHQNASRSFNQTELRIKKKQSCKLGQRRK